MKTWGIILLMWLVTLVGVALGVNRFTVETRDRQWEERIAAGEFLRSDTVEFHHRDTLWRTRDTVTGVMPPYIPDTAAYLAEIEALKAATDSKDNLIEWMGAPAKWEGDLIDGVWLQANYTPTRRTFYFKTRAATYIDSVVQAVHSYYAILKPTEKPFFGGLYAEAMAGGDYGDKLFASNNKRLDLALGAELWPAEHLLLDLSPARVAVVGDEVGIGWRVGLRYKIIQP